MNQNLENVFKRFVGPVTSAKQILKEEKERAKRVAKYRKLRKMVEERRAKLAYTQKKMEAK